MGVHGPLNISEVGSGAMEYASAVDQSHLPWAQLLVQVNGVNRRQEQLTIDMKHIRQHVAQRKVTCDYFTLT
jgi:hypothetical protein